jgi:DNA repair protein RecO (recombination protein O)
MIQSATGLILRTRPLTETSLIVHWLTPEFGRIATVAKGARRPKSPFLGRLDLFYEANFCFSRSRRSDLHTLREVELREMHVALRKELGCLQQSGYCATLIEQTTETEIPLPAIHQLMRDFLAFLPQQPPQPRNIFAFELKLLQELGLRPDVSKSRLTPGAKQISAKLARLSWSALSTLKPSALQTREIQQFLHGFLVYHLGKIPPGRAAALQG